MTCIAIWYEAFDKVLWAVGDTRTINHLNGSLSEASAKIFPLTVKCFVPGTSGFFDNLRLSRTLGFAFAGNTFSALQTYSALNAALQHMIGLPDLPLPSMADVAMLAQRLGTRYFVETLRPFEMAVFGCCPASNTLQVFHLEWDASRLMFDLRSLPETTSASPLLLGSHKPEIAEAIAELDAKAEHALRRTPSRVLASIIREGRFPDVGGTLQIGTTRGREFGLMSYMQPSGNGPQCAMVFLGLDVETDLGQVGAFKVAPMGTI
ncbi:hypothetical protein Snov_0604 [Ancylobacter novellus DSM 506]|uniref:Uncharacterized protein n=2 Tax=Ancylobacter novellus TaxID=921 RepID=D7A4N9_ANCN5|nr:hypothetical protein Snov_0604 [Ancylobacter novellus DSM 506]